MADRARRLAQALGGLGELEPDLAAGELARLRRLGERHPRADEQRLDRRDRRVHRNGDLLVGERVHLAQKQRGALGLGKVLNVGDQRAEVLAASGPDRRW